jgi:hypothetical protein
VLSSLRDLSHRLPVKECGISLIRSAHEGNAEVASSWGVAQRTDKSNRCIKRAFVQVLTTVSP